jgi:hypothetical protein
MGRRNVVLTAAQVAILQHVFTVTSRDRGDQDDDIFG